jgi:aldehyde dehydrogenase (NAD+)
LALDPLVGAIAAGCAVVIKPSEIAPATSAFLAKMIPLYMDKEAIRVVEGGVQQITALLDQKWDKIFFTGNAKVGRIIMAAAAKHLTPVTLELGGKCPLYIDSTVDLKVAAKRIVIGKWGSSCGQACISPNHLLVEESFVPKLVILLHASFCFKPVHGQELLNPFVVC